MNGHHPSKQLALSVAFFCICAMPTSVRAQTQSGPPATAVTPHLEPPASQRIANLEDDDFAGLTYTDEQKAKIDEIRKSTKSHIEAVIKDDHMAPEAKDAMIQGYQRLEANAIFGVLTPAQRVQVNKHVAARRAAAQEAQKNQKKAAPAPGSNSTPTPN